MLWVPARGFVCDEGVGDFAGGKCRQVVGSWQGIAQVSGVNGRVWGFRTADAKKMTDFRKRRRENKVPKWEMCECRF
jgi:hypothetical protein